MNRKLFLCIGSLTLLSLGCSRGSSMSAADERSPSRSGDAILVGTPPPTAVLEALGIAESAVTPGPAGAGQILARCLTARLRVGDQREGKPFTGSLLLTNTCDLPVAVLASPCELRVRDEPSDSFIHEKMIHTAYARLYIFRRDLGIEDAFSPADGGIKVFGQPSYIIVPANASLDVSVASSSPHALGPIPAGEYGAFFMSIVSPFSEDLPATRVVLVDNDVADHNSAHSGAPQVFIQPEDSWLMSDGSFFVYGLPQ